MSNKQIKIMLDAGHYGNYNQSPVVGKYWESKQMWKLHLLLKAELESYGFIVGTTRPQESKDLAVDARGKLAQGYDLFISLHSNAAVSESVDRVDVYASYKNLNNSHELAGKLAEAIANTMKVSDGYVKTRKSTKGNWEYYGVLRGAASVGCPLFYIIEHSFHTNKRAATWLLSDQNLASLAVVEAETIAKYFGLAKKHTVEAPKKSASKKDRIRAWQEAAIKDGFKFPEHGADGSWGAECESVAKQAVVKKRIIHRYKNLTKLVQVALGFTGRDVDGKCGKQTRDRIIKFQSANGLEPDGKVGPNTWKKILGI